MRFSIDERVRYFKMVVLLAFFAGLILSHSLWMNYDRSFPIIAPFQHLPTIPFPFDISFLLIFIGGSIWWLIHPQKRLAGFIAIGGLLAMLLQDQMRWQPWVYLYLLLLLPFLFQSNKNSDSRTIYVTLQYMVAGVYVWSGIHKLNPNFIDVTFVRGMQNIGLNMESSQKNIGYFIPLIEMSIGFALLHVKLRKIGIYAAIITHVIILFYLSFIMERHNTIVYPWNLAMITFVLFIFGDDDKSNVLSLRVLRFHYLNLLLLALVWLAPILNLFEHWDHFLSFSFYSNKPPEFYIAVEESQISKLDPHLQHFFVNIPGLDGGKVISIDEWSMHDLNVPFYPEQYTFKKLCKPFCSLGIPKDKIAFIEMIHQNGKQQFNTFTCE